MLTPATITVTFTANYAGPHRICWRQCGVGPYVCTNIVDCVGGGNVCAATVSIMVDPESCTPVCFEGYIQATCNPEGSPVDQVFWTSTFTPTPSCTMYDLLCTIDTGCPNIPAAVMGLNCDGTARPDVGPVNPIGAGIHLCAQNVIPNLPAGFLMTPNGKNCCDCSNYTISLTPVCPTCVLDGTSLYYIDCATKELKKIDFSGSQSFLLDQCAITGSISLQLGPEASGTVTLIGPC